YIGFAQGFERYGKQKAGLKEEAIQLASSSDTIVFFAGLDELSEAEGIDRSSMNLPANQLELFSSLCSLGKKIVVVLFCGSPVELDVLENADGILHAYLGGQAAASALLNILTGQVNPSGKLAESYPFRYSDVPSANYWHTNDFVAEYREGFFVGYRYYATADIPVRFPFGYGLSYTCFAYSDLKTDETGVSFTITNTGKRAGAETAQLYIAKQDSCIPRPCRELKGFR
ncbi:MAG: glycoside hydrolase family 3 C-terminal domain-containing protein, partial [Erysipelotrichaceae bacterium]|nr:glycoside hydrolase family 3 C-terminal domain-containing protein [Erysipelotrichaceae bacterium]